MSTGSWLIAAWLIAAVVFFIIEITTVNLTTIWFTGGALIAMVSAYAGFPVWEQMLIFIIVSIVLLVPLKPWAKRKLNNKTVKTNADGIIGKTAVVTEEIDNLTARGQVKVGGQIWSARSRSDETVFQKGEVVTIEEIIGVKAVVRAAEPEEEGGFRLC